MRRIGALGGLGLATVAGLIAATSSPAPDAFHYGDYPYRPRPKRPSGPVMGWPFDDEGQYIPNDHGPVIDTSPESKRARRRRLAKRGR